MAAGTVTLNKDTFSHNKVVGGTGQSGTGFTDGGAGGSAYGGGVFVAMGTVTLSNDVLEDNMALGAAGGPAAFSNEAPYGGRGGAALGGALYVASDGVTLSNDTLSGNEAIGGSGGDGAVAFTASGGVGGNGMGGGLYVYAGVSVLQHSSDNTISGNSVAGGVGAPPGTASFANLAANGSGVGNFGFSTSTVVTTSPNPSIFLHNVILTATVAAIDPGTGTPTGSVTFYDGTTPLGSARSTRPAWPPSPRVHCLSARTVSPPSTRAIAISSPA